MKQRLQGLIVGVLIGAMVTGGTVYAETISKTVDVVYDNIKIFIDGAAYVAKDANGTVVEPFVYNGTTYLPVRGIANAFGKDVVWDGDTSSIYLGKKDQNQPDNWLDRIQYSYYESGTDNSDNGLYKINGTVTDFTGNNYSNGYLFKQRVFQPQKLDIPVNLGYSTFSGKISMIKDTSIIGLEKESYMTNELFTVEIYGDDNKIYTSPMSNLTTTFNFEVKTKGVSKLTIKVIPQKIGNLRSGTSMIALTDLALYK